MSDDLNPYPGNLRRHIVPGREERAKTLSDMMNDDQKDGLYQLSTAELREEFQMLLAACDSFQGAYSLCANTSSAMDMVWELAESIIAYRDAK